mgnify:CR=1 FL=1
MLVNYKPWNDNIVANQYSVCRVESLTETLQQANYFSVLDLPSGYYQFPITKESQYVTAFKFDGCPLMEFKVIPQGLKVKAAAMSKSIYIFQKYMYKSLVAYLGDLCVYG